MTATCAAVSLLPLSPLRAAPFAVTGLLDAAYKGDITDVNDAGQFVGSFYDFDIYNARRSFLYDGSTYVDVGDLGSGPTSSATALNNSAEVTGTSVVSFSPRAFVYFEGTTSPIGGGGGTSTYGLAINDPGQIAGQYRTGLDKTQPFVYRDGTLTPLGNLGGTSGNAFYGQANGINTAGMVVGESSTANLEIHAFLYSDESGMTGLGTLGGTYSRATAINSSGQIIGDSTTAQGANESFLYENGVMRSIEQSGARAINDFGHVLVGSNLVYYSGVSYVIDDIESLAAGFMSDGITPGFTNLLDIQALSNGYIVGTGQYFNGTDSELRHYRMSFFMPEFVWEGAEGFAFDHAPNWSEGVVPGTGDTVRLTEQGLKTIELPTAGLVNSGRLLASNGSDTEVDLKTGIWRLGATAGAAGDLRVEGATVEFFNGTVEVNSGAVVVANHATAGSFLGVKSGGKLRAPDGVISIGQGPGAGAATLQVTGSNSLVEAFTITVGDQGKGNLFATDKASVIAEQNFNVAADGVGAAIFSGGAELQVLANGSLAVGLRAAGSLTFENGGKALLGTGATTFIGNGPAGTGTVDVRGLGSSFSSLAGGRIVVRQGGILNVREEASLVATNLDIEGGAVSVTGGAQTGFSGTVAVFSGGSLEVSGQNTAVSTEGFFLAGGQVTIDEGAFMEIQQSNGERARMLGGVLDIGAGSELLVNTLELEGGTIMGKGTLYGGVLHTGGYLRPGNSPGVLTIVGDYELDGGTLVLEIGGTGAGTQYDQFIVSGNLILTDGTIELAFSDGFAPQTGQTFSFFNVGGGFTGTTNFAVSGLEEGWQFSTAFNAETGAFGLTSLNNGIAVPEPGSALLLLGGLVAVFGTRRRSGTKRPESAFPTNA